MIVGATLLDRRDDNAFDYNSTNLAPEAETDTKSLAASSLDLSDNSQIHKLPPLSEFKPRWFSIVFFAFICVGSLFAFLNFSWSLFLSTVILGNFVGIIGISVGYHRLITHKAFETTRFVYFIHLLAAAICMQLGPVTWAKTHKRHHMKSDTDEDPHTQIYGLFWGFCGWVFLWHPRIGRSPLKKVIKAEHLSEDRMVQFFERYWFWIGISFFAVLYLLGGLQLMLWFGCVRVLLVSLWIWTLNVTGHGFGFRRFPTKDRSTNSLLVALLSGGEGFHNNHHFFPSSARFGLYPWEIDFGYYWIRLLAAFGLTWDVKEPRKLAPDPAGPSFEKAGSKILA